MNAVFAAKIMADDNGEEANSQKRAKTQSILADERFQNMFEDPAYAIDEQADDYKVLHPNAGGSFCND